MHALVPVLDLHRRRLRALRAADVALRGAFRVSLLAAAGLLAARLAGWSWGGAASFAGLGAAAVVLAIRELLRRFTRRDCAVALDRALGLEERLATALEGAGPMKDAQAADAAAALARAQVPAWHPPREAKWLAGSLLVMASLSAAPVFERRSDAEAARTEAFLAQEAATIEAMAKGRIEFKEAADALRAGRVEEALLRIQAIREGLAAAAASEGAGGADARRTDEALGLAAQGLGAELGRAGRTVLAPSPAVADAKRRRLLEAGSAAGAADLPPARRAAAMDANDWDHRYDAVVRAYFRGLP
jgi:hypothetical protein